VLHCGCNILLLAGPFGDLEGLSAGAALALRLAGAAAAAVGAGALLWFTARADDGRSPLSVLWRLTGPEANATAVREPPG